MKKEVVFLRVSPELRRFLGELVLQGGRTVQAVATKILEDEMKRRGLSLDANEPGAIRRAVSGEPGASKKPRRRAADRRPAAVSNSWHVLAGELSRAKPGTGLAIEEIISNGPGKAERMVISLYGQLVQFKSEDWIEAKVERRGLDGKPTGKFHNRWFSIEQIKAIGPFGKRVSGRLHSEMHP